MTDEQKAAYVIGQAVAAFIELEGMIQENKRRESLAEAPAYQEADFLKLHENYCICHHPVLTLFHG